MAVFRIAVLGVRLAMCVGVLPGVASAAVDPASCVSVTEDAARLACYDRAFGRGAGNKPTAAAGAEATGAAVTGAAASPPRTAVTQTPAATPATPAAPKDPVAEFGLTEAAKQAKDPVKAAEAAAAPTSVTGKVISVRFRKFGEFVVTLDNGQVWEQIEPMASAVVRVGDTVTVRKAVLGSYTLVTVARVATKVRRVD
jgi:hypothetical protein